MRRRSPVAWAISLIALVALVGGCAMPVAGTPGAAAEAPAATEVPDTGEGEEAGDEPNTALPAGAEPGIDDIDGDGLPDPTCSRQDYGGGLVLRIPCTIADYSAPPTDDTTLVPNSMHAFPGMDIDLSEVSGSALQARDADGRLTVLFFNNSDTLFDAGSATLGEPAQASFGAVARIVQANWPTAPVQVRGHTDSTESTDAQALSESRAAAALEFLASNGIDRAQLTSAGFGSTVPIVLETNDDGSVNETGQQYNRRVEFVVTVPES